MSNLKITMAIFLAITLTACAGSSDKNTAPAPIPSSTASTTSSASSSSVRSVTSSTASSTINNTSAIPGIYDVRFPFFSGVYTFLDNGNFSGLHFVSDSTLAGHPHGFLSATNSPSSREHISWANFIDAADGFGFQEQNGMFGRSFTSFLSVSITGLGAAPGMVFTATANQQKTYSGTDKRSLYNDPIPLTTIAGTYNGILRTVGINKPITNVTNFSITNDGLFTITAVDCTFTGTLVQHGITGVFDVQVITSGTSCQLAPTLKGIVVPLAFSDNKPQLSLQLDDLNNIQSAVFIISK